MAFARVLVVPPAHQLCAVPDALAGDVIERHLYDQLGTKALPHELLLRLPAARLSGAALTRSVGLELPEQLALLLGLESGRVADDVQAAVVVIQPQDQRADRPLLLAEAERRDDRVSRADPLDLHHPLALARLIRGVEDLRDHALRRAREPLAGVVGARRHGG